MEPNFLQPGEGERITGDSELGVTLLADLEQIGITDIRSEPGGRNPPLHAHAQHAECFFVLMGTLTFRLEDRELEASPETWVFVPPEVVHTFGVTGDTRARFLDIHVPSSGFGDFVRGLHFARNEDELRAMRATFDQHPPPEYSSADPGSVVVRTGATAKTVTLHGNRIAFLTEADEAGGAIGAIEYTAPHAFEGPPPHIHRKMFDIVVVLEGTLGIQLGGEAHTAGVGAFVLVPPGAPHTFSNPSDEPLRFLNLYVPGGFERFMPCLKRENGKVVAGYWKDGGITVKLMDGEQRQAALDLPGAQLFDPGMGRVMREWVHVPAAQSGVWERLVEQAIG